MSILVLAALYIFVVISTIYIVHIGIYLIGANIYDIWQFRRKHNYRQSDQKEQKEALVSILIPAHNEEAVIIRCLNSVVTSTYRRLQIIVIDDGSTDRTYQTVLDYKRLHPDRDISLVRRYKNVGKGIGLNAALKHRVKGKFVMTLDADSVLDRNTIRHAISYFRDSSIVGVAANVRIIGQPTILGILQRFEHMVGYRSKKMYSLTGSEFVVGGVASTYRMDVLKEVDFYDTDTQTEDIGLSIKIIHTKGNRLHRIVYGADVVAFTEGVQTYRALFKQRFRWKYGSLQNLIKYRHLMFSRGSHLTRVLTWYRLPMAIISELVLLFSPLLWVFVVYISWATGSWTLLIGAYITITVYTLVVLWFDEHLPLRHRLRLTLYAPLLYFAFYIMETVQFVAVARCLAKTHHLLTGKDQHGVWVSPERGGEQVTADSLS